MDKEIIDSNIMIFDFMGCIHSKDKTIDLWEMSKTRYHYSWSELMPVVEKICKFKFDDGENEPTDYSYLRSFGMLNDETGEFMVRFNRGFLFQDKNLMKATYMAVVEFIKWYNSKTQTNG